jgi:hypothetical protein
VHLFFIIEIFYFLTDSAVNVVVPIAKSPCPVEVPVHNNINLHGTSPTDPSSSLPIKTPDNPYSSKPSVVCPNHISARIKLPATSLDKHLPISGCLKARETETPEATIKMAHFSPNVSPTTEIKMFSGACLSVRMLESINGIDLNASSFEAEYNCTFPSKKIVCSGPFSLSHWEMKFELPDIEQNIVDGFFDWLRTTSSKELERYKVMNLLFCTTFYFIFLFLYHNIPFFPRDWIVHSIPRFIKISGYDLKHQFAMQKPMTFDLFDLAIRRIKQLDKVLYPNDIHLKWRHLLESDFTVSNILIYFSKIHFLPAVNIFLCITIPE